MSCKCAKPTDEYHGWECEITGGACMFLFPNQKQCHEFFEDVEEPNNNKKNTHMTVMAKPSNNPFVVTKADMDKIKNGKTSKSVWEDIKETAEKFDKYNLRGKYKKQREDILKFRDYYLSHIDKFVEKYLGIKLTLYQKLMIKLLKFNYCLAWAYSKCVLLPNYHITIVTDSANESSDLLIKFVKLLDKEAKDGVSVVATIPYANIEFKNGSVIKILKPKVSSKRSNRAKICRLN